MLQNGGDNALQKNMLAMVAALATVGVILLLLARCNSLSINDADKFAQIPPALYDQVTGELIPASEQWLIPVQAQHGTVQQGELEGNVSWVSPAFNASGDKLNIYTDYAGTERRGAGLSKIYSAPTCVAGQCAIYDPYGHTVEASGLADNLLNDRTVYAARDSRGTHQFYSYIPSTSFKLDATSGLAARVVLSLDDKHQLTWLRVSVHANPIGPQSNFMLSTKYQVSLKALLLLVPLLLFYEYRKAGGFYSQRALLSGGLLLALCSMHALLWNINYMVISCLLIGCAGALYTCANTLFRPLFVFGYAILVVFAYQHSGGLNGAFVARVGLMSIIGLGLFLQKPE